MSDQDLASIIRRLAALEALARRPRAEVPMGGTFTPTYYGQSTAGVTTYSIQVGAYTRVGDRVDFTLRVDWTAVTGTGNALVGGLPFTARNTSGLFVALSQWYSNVTYTGNGVACVIGPNTNFIALWDRPASGGGAAQLAIEAAGTLILSGTYFL